MDERIQNAQRRAIQYWFVDGLAELSAGVTSLLLAVLFLLWGELAKTRWSLLIFFLIPLAVSVVLRLVIQKVKQRITYPRTGYVAPLQGFENKRAVLIAAAFALLLLAVNATLAIQGSTAVLWSSSLAGLTFAFVFGWISYVTGLRRFAFLALFTAGLGASLGFLGAGYWTGVAVLCGCTGVILLFYGIMGLREYSRQTPSSAG